MQLGGLVPGLVPVGPTKVKVCKSILFTEGIPEVEITFLELRPFLGLIKFNVFKGKLGLQARNLINCQILLSILVTRLWIIMFP